jgi:hypothetical protein
MTRPQPEKDTRKFTSDVVEDLLQQNLKGSFKPPRDAGRRRLTEAFNRIYEREEIGEVYDSPHMFWSAGANPPSGEAVRVRWHRFARELAEIIQAELAQTNSGTRLSDDGPVARVTFAVIYMITGEKPASTKAVAREVRRQQKA